MLNTGLLLRKPGESSYSRYRRFLIANKGLTVNIKRKKANVKKVNKSINQVPNYRLLKYAKIKEDKFIKKNNISEQPYFVKFKNYFRPLKSCPSCMEIGYHSLVFEYEWLVECPVHKEELTGECPSCNRSWPNYTELRNRNCPICGVHHNLKLFSKKMHRLNHYTIFELIEHIVEIRTKELLLETVICLPQVEYPYHGSKEFKQTINKYSILIFSVLRKMQLISDAEANQLSRAKEIYFDEIETISSPYKIISHKDLFTNTQYELLKSHSDKITEYESIIIQKNKHSTNNPLSNYISENDVCTSILPSALFLVLAGRYEELLDSKANNWWDVLRACISFQKLYARPYSMIWSNVIDKLVVFNYQDNSNVSYLKIPDTILIMMLEVELSNLVKNILTIKEKYNHTNKVSWKNVYKELQDLIVTTSNFSYPIAFALKEKTLTAFVRKY